MTTTLLMAFGLALIICLPISIAVFIVCKIESGITCKEIVEGFKTVQK